MATGHAKILGTYKARDGFTIVELLIVVVVIAILAAITIVAYNGIQNRAKQAAAQSAVSQAAKKIMSYAVVNDDQYPPDLTTAGVNDTTGLQYSVNNSVSPRTFGVTATNGAFSYYISSANTSPTAGGYPGHGQGGVATITNLAQNPTGTGGSQTGWAVSANTTLNYNATGGPTGGPYVFGTKTSSGQLFVDHGLSGVTVYIPVVAGQTYTFSAYGSVTAASALQLGILVRFYDAAATQIDSNTVSGLITPSNGVWNRWSRTDVVPATAVKARVVIVSNGAVAASGDILRMTNVMATSGSTLYNYADGTSANWAWNGTANASSSTGMPL